MTIRREHFVGAPADAVVTEEGWLVWGQEAWTLDEWLAFPSMRPGHSHKGRAYATEEERQAAKTESRRRWREARRRVPVA